MNYKRRCFYSGVTGVALGFVIIAGNDISVFRGRVASISHAIRIAEVSGHGWPQIPFGKEYDPSGLIELERREIHLSTEMRTRICHAIENGRIEFGRYIPAVFLGSALSSLNSPSFPVLIRTHDGQEMELRSDGRIFLNHDTGRILLSADPGLWKALEMEVRAVTNSYSTD